MGKHTSNELIGGFNHSLYVDTDLLIANADTAGTEATIEAFGIPAGGIVTDVCVHQITAFDGGGNGQAQIILGDGDDTNGYITVVDYFSGGDTDTVLNTGAYFNDGTTANTINGKVYQSADTLDVILGVDVSLSAMSTGAFLVCANIMDPAAYVPS